MPNKTTRLAALLLMAGVGVASGAYAHHSYAMFDPQKTLELAGTVTAWEWTNPHSYLDILVAGPNGAENWSIESASPAMLSRIGLSRNTLKAGDKITVKFRPRRDGSLIGSLISMDLPDGKTIAIVIPQG